MGEYVYEALSRYYNVLEKTGHMAYSEAQKLLVLLFYKDYIFNDYRGVLCQGDYVVMKYALDCLFGSNCLMPYPDYLKMGKLKMGDICELTERVKNLEESSEGGGGHLDDINVMKLIHDLNSVDNKDAETDVKVVLED